MNNTKTFDLKLQRDNLIWKQQIIAYKEVFPNILCSSSYSIKCHV